MQFFDYKARDPQGRLLEGVVEAPSLDVAEGLLRERDIIVLSLRQGRKKVLFQGTLSFLNRVPFRDVVIFARQLAVMISAGIPIVRALRVLSKQVSNTTFQIIIEDIAEDVDGGAKFSMTLARYPQIFDNFFVNMIRSGETTGRLDETLNYLADQKEKDYDLRAKVRGAMIYPAFIVFAMFLVGILMMVFVIPNLTKVLIEAGVELPIMTRILIGTSDATVNYWWLMLIIAAILFTLYRMAYRNERGRYVLDGIKLRIPIVGKLFQKIYLTRLTRSLSTLILSGVPIIPSLEIVGELVGNEVYRKLTLDTIKEVEDGKSIATLFAKHASVPMMLSQMMSIGEQSGRLDQIMGKLAEFYNREVENSVANLVALIEPLVILVLGAGVGLMIIAILLPMYQVTSTIK